MPRGKKPQTPSQLALIRKVKESRIALDSVDIEIEDRVAQLRHTLRSNAEEETRAAIWAALDAKIPIADLKKAMNTPNHDTFKRRWIEAYIPPIVRNFEHGWFALAALVELEGQTWYPLDIDYPHAPTLHVRLQQDDEWHDPYLVFHPDTTAYFRDTPEVAAWASEHGHDNSEILGALKALTSR